MMKEEMKAKRRTRVWHGCAERTKSMRKKIMRCRAKVVAAAFAIAGMAVVVDGCRFFDETVSGAQGGSANEDAASMYGMETCDAYIAFCRETAMTPLAKDPDDPTSKADWMVGSSETTQQFSHKYEIVYADKDYLSFWCDDYYYTGGAHGTRTIKIGTIDRKTGHILTLNDVFKESAREALTKELRDKAIKKLGGEQNLQYEVKPIDNFCLKSDGWHFVYNEYEIACYAVGPVEIVVPR